MQVKLTVACAALAALWLSVPVAASETERLNAFFEELHQAAIKRWPQWQTNLGLKGEDYDKWNDRSEARRIVEHERSIRNLTRLQREFRFDQLDRQAQISYRLFERGALLGIEWFPFRHHYYPITHRGGIHKGIPTFLINKHKVDTPADAEAYVGRLNGVDTLMRQVLTGLKIRAARGIIPPRFVFAPVQADIRRVTSGAPFDDSGVDSTLLADFRAKVEALELSHEQAAALLADAEQALRVSVKPAYDELARYFRELEPLADTRAGVWKFPEGDAYYALALRGTTTTDMSADEIHDYGLGEVARIQEAMRVIVRRIGFEGELQDFFAHMRAAPGNFYPNTDEGRAAYLTQTKRNIATMQARLPEIFNVLPERPLEVRRVESFREQTTGRAFYESPALYGNRPGVYYVNLHDMRRMPKSHLQSLAYHESVPGHHMQIAIAQKLGELPRFRQLGGYGVYTEGWALYAERLADEMGAYVDPYAEFGWLSWDLLRAARLVVDTGIHARRWTREQAIAYLDTNLPDDHATNTSAIERYIVWPSQATGYAIGMRRILELRAMAREQLGEQFDLRAFHDVVLTNGALPLDLLETLVVEWVEQTQ